MTEITPRGAGEGEEMTEGEKIARRGLTLSEGEFASAIDRALAEAREEEITKERRRIAQAVQERIRAMTESLSNLERRKSVV